MNYQELIGQMTFEEKASLLTGAASMTTGFIPRLDVPQRLLSDGPHGVRIKDVHDSIHFPNMCCAGASWDVEMLKKMGEGIAEDCIEHGVSMILAPGINVKRHILCGRNFEYISEDPCVNGELGAAYISGVQGKGVATSLKHFAANSQEIDRLVVNAEIDERTLREIYLRGFEIAVKKSAPESVMCAYNKVNAIWCSENRNLLTEILRDDWGYEGFVISDWGAVHEVCRVINAGLDLIMPHKDGVTEELRAGLEKGAITMEAIDQAVDRLLCFLKKERPAKNPAYSRDAQHQLAREIAASGVVLMKNERDALPLTAEKYRRIAIVGEYAENPLIGGQGSAEVYVDSKYIDSPLAELKKQLPDCELLYWKGYEKTGYSTTMLWPTMSEYRKFVDGCDAVVVFIGAMESEDTESFDRRTAQMNPNFDLYIDNAVNQGKKVIVVLQNGGAMILGPWHKNVDAIVEMWLGGEAAGGAIADVLCGKVNPSGKLTETFPNRMRADLVYPGEGRILEYNEKLNVGYRYYDKHPEEIVYPFGHGLSYTRFAYGSCEAGQEGENFRIRCEVTNIGPCDGAEVVQLYVSDPESIVTRPLKELRAFSKVALKAGETRCVEFMLTPRDLAYYNVALHDWVAEDGEYVVMLGSSSQDIRQTCRIEYRQARMPYTVKPQGETMLG